MPFDLKQHAQLNKKHSVAQHALEHLRAVCRFAAEIKTQHAAYLPPDAVCLLVLLQDSAQRLQFVP